MDGIRVQVKQAEDLFDKFKKVSLSRFHPVSRARQRRHVHFSPGLLDDMRRPRYCIHSLGNLTCLS